MTRIRSLTAVLFLHLCLPVNTHADTTISIDDGTRIMVRGNLVKIRPGNTDEPTMIYDSRVRTMSIVDDGEGRILQMDEASLDKQMTRMNAYRQQAMQQMQAMLEQMPAEQRAMLEQQMQGGMPGMPSMMDGGVSQQAPVKTVDLDQERKVDQWTCRMYRTTRDTQVLDEVCLASPDELGIPRPDYDVLRAFFSFVQTLSDKASSMAGQMAGTGGGYLPPEHEGLPVWSRNHANNETSKVTSVSTKPLPDSDFSLPDYPVTDMGQMGASPPIAPANR